MNDHMTLDDAHLKGFELVREHTARFAAYVRALTPEQVERPVPGSDWTVGETIVHVQSVYERYTIDRRRAATHSQVAAYNHEDVARIDIDMETAASSMEVQVNVLADFVDHVPPDQEFPFHAGVPITMAGGWGNLLGELLAHGDDIAQATGHPFEVPGCDLEILWRFAAPALTGWLRPETRILNEIWDVEFPFGSVRLSVAADAFTVDNDPDDSSPVATRHEITVDDVAAWTLAFPYRRRVIADPQSGLLASRFYDL